MARLTEPRCGLIRIAKKQPKFDFRSNRKDVASPFYDGFDADPLQRDCRGQTADAPPDDQRTHRIKR